MADLKEYQPAQVETDPIPEKQAESQKINKPRRKARHAFKNILGAVKEKDLIDPFTEELVELEREVGFVEAVKQLERKLPKFYGFSIQQWHEIYQNTKTGSTLHRKALDMMERLEFDARSLEEMQILHSIAQPGSQLQREMQERMSRIK